MSALTPVTYGNHLLDEYFLLKPGLLNFNHGSFGTVPKPVMDTLVQFLREEEAFPDLWFRESYLVYKDESRRLLAGLIKASVEDLVMVENASYAVNSVLRSFPFQRGDKVLVFSSAYRMVLDTLLYLQQLLGVEVVKVDIPYPLEGAQELVNAVEVALQRESLVRICIFSHISSMPTMIEPVKALIKVAKAHGCVVMIDGAHAPGVLDIDVEDIGADLYTGNCHKWLYAPKGCAFLWVSAAYRQAFTNSPQPVVISSTGWYDFTGRFAYTGTRDYTPFTTLPASFRFIESIGGMDSIRGYCRGLLQAGCDHLVAALGTSYLVPFSMQAFMANIILPVQTLDEANALQRKLDKEHNMFVVVGAVPRRQTNQDSDDKPVEIVFMRISAQVYLEMKDFELLAVTMRKLLCL